LPDASAEVRYAAEFFRWYSEEAVRLNGEVATAPAGTNRILVLHKPIAVALPITPWNVPAAMATRKIGPALAAGRAVVLKPASATPLTALALGKLLIEAGVPAGVVNVIPRGTPTPWRPGSSTIHGCEWSPFTGSTEVGRGLLAHAGSRSAKATRVPIHFPRSSAGGILRGSVPGGASQTGSATGRSSTR
jgi:succinate-semialdehyde dehydrogenase / glutarate-semialdehyde dehydrogenase